MLGTNENKIWSVCCEVVHVLCWQGSRRSDEEALEEQVRRLGEELREVRELYEAEQDKARSSKEELLQLHNQVLTQLHNHTHTHSTSTHTQRQGGMK